MYWHLSTVITASMPGVPRLPEGSSKHWAEAGGPIQAHGDSPDRLQLVSDLSLRWGHSEHACSVGVPTRYVGREKCL